MHKLSLMEWLLPRVDHWKSSVWDFEILGFHWRFLDFRKDFKISGKISKFPRFQERFQDFVEILRFHVRFQDFQKNYARFLARFQWRFSRFPDFKWRFLQDFQILVQILTYWFWISGYVIIYCIHAVWQCTGRNLHSSIYTIFCVCGI